MWTYTVFPSSIFIYVPNNSRSSGNSKPGFCQFLPNDNTNIMERQMEWLEEATLHLHMLSETIWDFGFPSICKSGSRVIVEANIHWILCTVLRIFKIDYKIICQNKRLGEMEDHPWLRTLTVTQDWATPGSRGEGPRKKWDTGRKDS